MAFNNPGNRFQQTTPIVLNLIIINVLVYLAQAVTGGNTEPSSATDLFALHHYKSIYFQPYQVITHMFMHGGFFHLFFNMFALWMFGSMIERIWGPKRFLIFYMICGIGAAIAQMATYAIQWWDIDHSILNSEVYDLYQTRLQERATVGASGAIMGILVAFGYLFPNTELFIMPIPFPVKAKWAVIGMILLDLFGGFAKLPGDNTAHFAHLGGAAVGFILLIFWNKTNKKTFW